MTAAATIVAARLTQLITRDNVDELLDRRMIELYSVHRGKWYSIRRAGKTQLWKRDARKIRIPCKVGWREHFSLTETDFWTCNGEHRAYLPDNGIALSNNEYRIKP